MNDGQPSPIDQRRTAQIILDPTVVRSLTDVAMQDALAIIACALPALEIADMVTPIIPGATITMTFPARPEEIAFRRARCRAWLLTKGLHEITRAVRMSLELAYCYLKIVELFRNGLVPAETYNEQDALFRKTANKLPFPELLKRVGEVLEMPLEFAEEYQALNKVRNCLEHRDGIVGVSDVDENGVLRLILPRMEIVVAHDDGTESLVVIGQETRGGQLLYRRGRSVRTYAIGDAIEFDAKNFAEIAQSCVFFGSDLASKLPGGDQVGGAA